MVALPLQKINWLPCKKVGNAKTSRDVWVCFFTNLTKTAAQPLYWCMENKRNSTQ